MKTKNNSFKSSMGKLFKSLKPYLPMLITALVLIIISTVCMLTGPNRLSEVTNVIQKGISINLTLSDEELTSLKNGNSVTSKQINADNLTAIIIFNYVKDVDNSTDGFVAEDVLNINIDAKITTPNEEKNVTVDFDLSMGDVLNAENGFFDITSFNGADLSALGGVGVSWANNQLSLWVNTKAEIDIVKIVRICVLLVVLYLISYATNYAENYIMAILNNKVSYDLRKRVIEKINKLPLSYFDKIQYGEVLSRMVNDVDTIGTTLNNSFTDLIAAGMQFIGSLIMMFATNWIMALAGVGATLIGFAFMFLIINKSQRYFVEQQRLLGLVNGEVEEAYSGQDVIKAYNAEAQTLKNFDKKNDKLYATSWRAQFYSGIMHPLMGFIGNLGYVVVCVVGALLVHFGKIHFSVIVAIMIYIRLFTQPLAQLGQAGAQLQTTAAASSRVFELLEADELTDESAITNQLANVKGNIEFKHVKFGYTPNKIIIKDFSVKVKAGQKVAIVGPTGAGKTTLVNLIMKFYDINDGDILIDDVSIKDLTRENIHQIFSMVLQDTWLFQGTVKENLRFNKTDVTDEQIIEACKASGVDHLIKTLPKGYDTVLDDNTNISAGQKQLLTIARAMVEDSPMLILDEATSSVDTRTELLIQKAMDKLTKNRTSFVIAHRLSTIKNADIILVMKDGDVVEIGNHKTLIKQNGLYAELYNSQFEN